MMNASAKVMLFLLSIAFCGNAQEGKITIFKPYLITTPHLLCTCTGTADLPNGTILQLSWKRVFPDGETAIAHQYALVHKGRFQAAIGPFAKNIHPGAYRLVAFCSPGLQASYSFESAAMGAADAVAEKIRREKLAKIGFVKDSLLFHTGTPQRYQSVFDREYKWMDKILPQVERCFAKSQHDYSQAKDKGGLDDWLLGRAKRKKRVNTLRDELDSKYQKYLQAFFPGSYRDLNALLNLVEMFHYTAEVSLRGEGERFLRQRVKQFDNRYPKTLRRFHYNAIAMAPKKRQIPLLLAEMRSLCLDCRRKTTEYSKSEHDLVGLRKSATYLVRLRHLNRRISYFPPKKSPFVKATNLWLRDLKNILFEIEYNLPAEKKTTCYRLALASLVNWATLARKFNIDLDQADFPNFNEQWQKATTRYRKKDLLNASVKVEIDWILQQVSEVKELLDKREFPFDWQRRLSEREAELMRRQALNCQLASLYEENHATLAQYLCLCAYAIDFFELAGECEDSAKPDEVKNSLEQIDVQMKLLEKTIR